MIGPESAPEFGRTIIAWTNDRLFSRGATFSDTIGIVSARARVEKKRNFMINDRFEMQGMMYKIIASVCLIVSAKT